MVNLESGDFNKFFVIKIEDIENYLTNLDKMKLASINEKVCDARYNEGKKHFNKYLTINQDEPYATEVIEIMKKHDYWG